MPSTKETINGGKVLTLLQGAVMRIVVIQFCVTLTILDDDFSRKNNHFRILHTSCEAAEGTSLEGTSIDALKARF
jgi:hypothetical protein